MRRVSVVGNSGSGKTALARGLAARLGVEHVELDSVFHQPDWEPLPRDDFRARVSARLDAAAGGWAACGNYSAVRDLVWARADTVVWFDFPRRVVMSRVVRRTLRRVVTREELWNGNREPWDNLYRWDPMRNIVRWAWTRHDTYVERYGGAMTDPAWGHLEFVRLRHPRDAARWLADVTP